MEELKVNYVDFLADFNLYLCEMYGCRNAATFSETRVGCTVAASDELFYIYFRMWETTDNQLPYMSVILVQTSFRNLDCDCVRCEDCENCKEYQRIHFEALLTFLKAYAPIYGFQTLAIEEGPLDFWGDKTEYGFTPQYTPSEYRWQIVSFKALILPPNEK